MIELLLVTLGSCSIRQSVPDRKDLGIRRMATLSSFRLSDMNVQAHERAYSSTP